MNKSLQKLIIKKELIKKELIKKWKIRIDKKIENKKK